MKNFLSKIKDWWESVTVFLSYMFGKNSKKVYVKTYDELINAIAEGDKTIVLENDIDCTEPLSIDKDIHIEGQNHKLYHKGKRVGFAYDETTVSTGFYIAQSRIEHKDGTEIKVSEVYPNNVGIYRVKVDDSVKLFDDTANYINFSCGWTAYTFPVTKIEGGYLYFKSQGAEYCLDYDYYQGNHKKFTEFRLLGCSDEAYSRYIIKVTGGTLTLDWCVLYGGIQCRSGKLDANYCTFANCSEYAVDSDSKVEISNTNFSAIWKSVAKVKNAELNITDCTILDSNQCRQNCGIIDVEGDTKILRNTITNYGSYGIRVGKVKATTAEECPSVYVEGNHLDTNKPQGAVTDTGAIYVAANNKQAFIKDNTISNYTGRKNNHAIYCDDGTYNVDVINNVVTDNPTGYAISCRCAAPGDPSSSTYRGYAGGSPNTNRTIANNVVESGIWFGGSTDMEDNGCHYYGNIVEENTDYKSKIENVKYSN